MDLPGIPRHLLARPCVPDLTFLNSPRVLRMGVLNVDADYVYTHGQCAALAVAFWDRFGWPMVGVSGPDHFAPDHLLARLPDGRVLDIKGPDLPVNVCAAYDYWCEDGPHELRPVELPEIHEWEHEEDLPRQNYLAAHVFAVAVAQRYGLLPIAA